MAIFIFVITIAVGALYSAQAVNTRLEQNQVILDGVNLAVEVMSRDVRYGSLFHCETAIPNPVPATRRDCKYNDSDGGTVLILKPTGKLTGSTNQANDRIIYYVSNGAIIKNEYPYQATPRTGIQITSSDVNIDTLKFYVSGAKSSQVILPDIPDYDQPLITIIVSGTTIPIKKNVVPVSFSVQTSISSRGLDN